MAKKPAKTVIQAVKIDEITPEMEEWVNNLTPEQEKAFERQLLGNIARQWDNPEGYAAFYQLVFGKKLPKHAREWVEEAYAAHAEHKGVVIEAFRGSTKTTTMTVGFMAFRIGHEPHHSNLLVQVSDSSAKDNAAAIADIIANNEGWRYAFPSIVPDTGKGWGEGGYEVMRTDLPYEQWRAMCASRKDPSLLGLGVDSSELIGKHPSGLLILDDINDEKNTSSEREMRGVMKILTGTIFPMPVETTRTVFIGTPWKDNDCLSYVISTGLFRHVRTPIIRPDGSLTWERQFPMEFIERQKILSGSLEFARMFMLDLKKAANRVMKYQLYPSSAIKYNWNMAGGVDYASNRNAYKNIEGKGDYFAMAYMAKLPEGGAVVVDGALDRVTQAQAEEFVVRAQGVFPSWRGAGVESIGKGDDFVQTILRNPGLRITPMHSGRRSKIERLERELGPWLENGALRISDAETPFLNELRRELDDFPNNTHDDALDAVYYAMRMFPEVFVMPSYKPDVGLEPRQFTHKPNPFIAFGRK